MELRQLRYAVRISETRVLGGEWPEALSMPTSVPLVGSLRVLSTGVAAAQNSAELAMCWAVRWMVKRARSDGR